MLNSWSGSRTERAGTWVLAATLFVVPLAYCPMVADPFALAKRSVMLVAGLILWGLLLMDPGGDDRPALISAARPLVLLFLAAGAIACCVAVNRGLALWGLLDLGVGVGLFLGTTRFARDPRDLALLGRSILIAAALVGLGSILPVFIPEASAGWLAVLLPPSRGGSTFGDPGLAAQFLALALPIGVGAAALSSDGWRQACGALLGIVASALLFIGRPEGWWAGGAALGFVVVARCVQVGGHGARWPDLAPDPGGASLRAFLIAGIVVLFAVSVSRLGALYPSGRPIEPLAGTSLLSPTTGKPAVDRASAVPGTFALIKRHPLGVGPAVFRHAFLEVAWTEAPNSPFSLAHQAVHPGNAFLEMTAETGLLGGLAFTLLVLLVLIQACVAAARAETPWDVAGGAAFAAVGTLASVAFLGAPFQEAASSLLFWVSAGMVQVAMLHTGSVPGRLRFLRSRQGTSSRWRGRGSRAVYAAAALWLAVGAGLVVFALDRWRASALTLAGQGAYYTGRYEAALQVFAEAPVRRSSDHLAHALAASSCLRLGLYDRAAHEFGETLRRSPNFVAAYLGRAAAREAQGLWDLADADYLEALKIWPKNADIYLARANLDTRRGRLDDALDDYRLVMQFNPNLAEAYFRMGELFLRRNQLDEAIEAYRICGMKDPKYPRVHLRLGDVFFQKGLQEMALRYYQAAENDDDKSVEARLRVANALHALGQACDAKQALEAARDLETDTARRDAILDLLKKNELDCAKQGRPAPERKTPATKR